MCQVSGCTVSLHNRDPNAAYLRYKLCAEHLRAESVIVRGKALRFCQVRSSRQSARSGRFWSAATPKWPHLAVRARSPPQRSVSSDSA